MRQSLITLLGTTAVLFAFAGNARAQENFPLGPANYEQDVQIFAPFELDLDNMADDQWSGYFFEYNKLFWTYTGERTTVGSRNVSETITWFNGVQDSGHHGHGWGVRGNHLPGEPARLRESEQSVPPPTVIHNAIQNAGAAGWLCIRRSLRAWLSRSGATAGWSACWTVRSRTNRSSSALHRGQPMADSRRLSTTTTPTRSTSVRATVRRPHPGDRAFGFGSVPVMFETPPGFMLGFRDYMNNFSDCRSRHASVAHMPTWATTATATDPDTLPIPFFHIADDINGNGILAAVPIIVVGPDGVARTGVHSRLRRPARIQHLLRLRDGP